MKRMLVGLTALALVVGCGKKKTPSEEPAAPPATPAPQAQAAPAAPAAGAAVGMNMIGDGTAQNPMQVQRMASIVVDADLTEWSKVAVFRMPFMKNKPSGVYMAWNEKGLYGAVQAVDNKVVVKPDQPWTGDCFELWLDKSFARGQDRDAYSTQLVFSPAPDGKDGKGLVQEVVEGDLQTGPKGIECAWKKTAQGYNLEFFIPAEALKPAKMQPETKIGVNFALDNDGEPIYQFFHDKNADEGYRNPSTWGAIVLK